VKRNKYGVQSGYLTATQLVNTREEEHIKDYKKIIYQTILGAALYSHFYFFTGDGIMALFHPKFVLQVVWRAVLYIVENLLALDGLDIF
jgi:hypothetical protein